MPREAPRVTQVRLILGSALFIALFHNLTFFRKVVELYGSGGDAWVILPSLFVVLTCVLALLLSLAGFNRTLKPVLILVLVVSSGTAYFIDAYRVVIDSDMITNLLETDAAEAGDLLNPGLALYLLLLGVLPAVLVSRARLVREPFRKALAKRIGLVVGCLLLAGATVLASSDFYASFIRTHKVVRYYTNPTTPLYALVKFARLRLKGTASTELQPVAPDAARPTSDPDFELVVLVVGETARADSAWRVFSVGTSRLNLLAARARRWSSAISAFSPAGSKKPVTAATRSRLRFTLRLPPSPTR